MWTAPPVIIRWDNAQATVTHRLELPHHKGKEAGGLEEILQDCQPATFGLQGADVLDESYRKASKLDETRFSTNFSPYENGIIDTISQILFPSLDEGGRKVVGFGVRGVRAELYKLNVSRFSPFHKAGLRLAVT